MQTTGRYSSPRGQVLLGMLLLLLIPFQARSAVETPLEALSLRNAGYISAGAVPVEAAAVQIQGGVAGSAGDDRVAVAAADIPVYQLGDVVAAAVDHSPGLAAMQWQALSAYEQSDSVAGYGGLSSQLSVTAIHTNSPLGVFASRLSQGRVTQMDFDPGTLNDPDFFGNVEYKLMLMYPLFDSGRISLLSDAVALSGNAIDFDALGREHELTAKVIEAYFNHALLTDQLTVLGDADETVAELKRMIEQLYDEGLVIGSDIAAADVQLANIADEQNRAESYRNLIGTTLGILTGGAFGGEFVSEVPLGILDEPAPDLAQYTDLALEWRPDLRAMRLRVCAATNVYDEAIRKRNPVVGVFAEGKHSSPGFWENGHDEATFGAQLSFDLDTGGVIENEIDQKRADLHAANLGLQQMEEMAGIEVAQAHAEVVIARQSIETFTAQAERSGENLRVVRNRYGEGLTNYLDLRMAITQHKESRLRKVKAKHDYLLAYMRLLGAAGLTGTDYDPFLGDTGSADAPSVTDCLGGYDD